MDTSLNIALVGFGKFGKVYYKTLKKFKFKNIYIFKKNNSIKLNKKNLIKYNIDIGIVVTPMNTHYKISKIFIENKIPIILEKPVSKNYNNIKKLDKLSKIFKSSILVNYSDLYNDCFREIINKKKKIKKFKNISLSFGKYNGEYKDKNFLPFFDWAPHIIATLLSISNNNMSFIVEKNKFLKKKKLFFQEIIIKFKSKNINNGRIFFSNLSKKKTRLININTSNLNFFYDGVNKKNNFVQKNGKKVFLKNSFTPPLENIVKKLIFVKLNNKFKNDLPFSLKVHKIIDIIIKKLERWPSG